MTAPAPFDASARVTAAASASSDAGATPLARLAEAHGVETVFTDASDRSRTIADTTLQALLRAMDVDPSDPEASLAALGTGDGRHRLPPAVVAAPQAAGGLSVPLRPGPSLSLRLVLEDGTTRPVAVPEGADAVLLADVPHGLHRLEGVPGERPTVIVATPGACHLPEALAAGGRLWGVAVQVYLLRSANDWGIGDFDDLRRLVEALAAEGCAVVGLNPLHAMFLDDPEAASPYSPASRLLLNVLMVSVPALPEAADPAVAAWIRSEETQGAIARVRETALVDYTAVAALKRAALERCHAAFRDRAAEDRRSAYRRFLEGAGAGFERAVLFLALRDAMARDGRPDWHDWPEALRDPASSEVAAFARDNAALVDFFRWTQFVADAQLAAAAEAARAGGMAVGLYRDLAVGADPAGAETWANARAVIDKVAVGAPPDLFNPAGQSWGLPPFNPRRLREEGYASFVDLVRANMLHAGGLRIDHVMGLKHLWCIPAGLGPAEGAYLAYPLDDLLGVLALESHRHGALVVGEDLGTVPPGFRERMAAANVLSYRVLVFEKEADGEAFLAPDDYPPLSLAVAASHDLATLRGWWQSRDIDAKARLGLYADDSVEAGQRTIRDGERRALAVRLHRERLLSTEGPIRVEDFVEAAHRHLARTASALAVVQLDDITGEDDQVNIPATDRETPNWRRKYARTLEDLAADGSFAKVGRLMTEQRPGARSEME